MYKCEEVLLSQKPWLSQGPSERNVQIWEHIPVFLATSTGPDVYAVSARNIKFLKNHWVTANPVKSFQEIVHKTILCAVKDYVIPRLWTL